MDRRLRVKVADCSADRLCRIASQAGFSVVEGKKHCKIVTLGGQFVTTVPRHPRLKRETVRGVIKALNAFGTQIEIL